MDLSNSGLVTIATKQKFCCFPPEFLEPYSDLSSLPWSNPLPHTDNLEQLMNYLKKNSDQVYIDYQGSEKWTEFNFRTLDYSHDFQCYSAALYDINN